MTTKFLAEIQTRDPVGRIVFLTIEVEKDTSRMVYTPRLESGEKLSMSSVFRTGEVPPSHYDLTSRIKVFQEIEKKLRDNYPKMVKNDL